jgi:hypothetical protein
VECEVHVLTSFWDWDLAVWGIKSFYHHAGVDWPLVIHDGGGIDESVSDLLRRHFPESRIISAAEADIRVQERLEPPGFRALIRGRQVYNLMKKAIDFGVLCRARNVLLLDSDVLFFRHPTELIRSAQVETRRIILLRDYEDSYSIPRTAATEWFGVELPTCINSGLGVIPTGIIDLEFLDRVFASEKIPLDKDGFAEQTILALLAGKVGFAYLPDEYQVATGPVDLRRAGHVARHYVGPVKRLFFDEGVPHLARTTDMLEAQ